MQTTLAVFRDLPGLLRYLIKWVLLIAPLGAAVGSACALFLWLLDRVTHLRWQQPWLLFLLPVAGVAVGVLYHWFGRSVEGGSNLIVDEIHEPGGGVPTRIAPLVLIGTLATHLCGGSAGREGTAVQMGGGIASAYGRALSFLTTGDVRMLLMAGVAGGFGGVFGTPLAGTVFAMEVLAVGRMSYQAVLPCLIAAIIADWTCGAWGVHHTPYHIAFISDARFDWVLLAKVTTAAVAFGLTARLFAELAHGIQHAFKSIILVPYLRPALGGLAVLGMTLAFNTRDYLGLGVTSPDPASTTILSSFHEGGAESWSWLLKIAFTVVTLGSGFKGGEVTPLFFIGATLGNTLSRLLHAPTDLFAGLGFIAVFAAGANTPLACTIMAIELFGTGGSGQVVYYAVACFVAYLFSGHAGIYLSQRIATPKLDGSDIPTDVPLRKARELRRTKHGRANGTVHAAPNNNGELGMKTRREHRVVGREVGNLRIYLTTRIRGRAAKGWRKLLGTPPLYRDLVAAAKSDGILHATVHNSFHGYSGEQQIQSDATEVPNPHLTVCVELIDHRTKLEKFCKRHGELLRGRIMVYKHVEHWDIHHGILEEHDATPKEVEAESQRDD